MPRHSSAASSRTPSFNAPFTQRPDSRKIPFFQRQSSFSPTATPPATPSTQPSTPRSPSTQLSTSRSPSYPMRLSSMAMSTASDLSELDLHDLVANFKSNVAIRDRRWRLVLYRNVFVGSEAVQWMVTSGLAQTRADAVKLGLMMQDAGIIEHCVRDHDFKDADLFYKFIENDERGGVPLFDENRLVSWADFLASPIRNDRNLMPNVPDPSPDDYINDTTATATTAALGVDTMYWPMDQLNVKLLDNVHPPEWIDPVFDGVYNVVVIGAGAAGLVTAAGAAGVGAKVALVEANALGGDCLNVGCVPSKSLIHAANLAHTLRNTVDLDDAGISFDGPVKVDFGKTMKRIRRIRAQISENNSAVRYTRKLGVDVYFGYAKFKSETSVEINGKILNFRKCVIATGGYPTLPPIPGLHDLHERSVATMDIKSRTAVMTNETFFNMTELPRRLGVIGAGAVGMELGQAMQRLGSSVTIFGRSGKVLAKEDTDLAEVVRAQMEKDGVRFRLGVDKYSSLELTGTVSIEGYEELLVKTVEEGLPRQYLFDALLVATGRKANVSNLNLEAARVTYDVNKGVGVNDMLQTTNGRVFAVGDCCSAHKFTHAADFMARMVVRNALLLGKDKTSNLLIPYATYTTPEIAHVGLYERDLQQQSIAYKTFEQSFSENDRAICDGTTTGLVRFHVEDKSDAILGATIVGVNAGNMISEVTVAMQSKTGLGKLASVIHPYPTTAEAIRQAGDLYNRSRLTTVVKQVLRRVIKVQR